MITIDNAPELSAFLNSHEQLFVYFPGHVEMGDITGHGGEWRSHIELATMPTTAVAEIDDTTDPDCEAEEEEAGEDAVQLRFCIIQTEDGRLVPELRLEFHVCEVGIESIQVIPIGSLASMTEALQGTLDQWELGEHKPDITNHYETRIFLSSAEAVDRALASPKS